MFLSVLLMIEMNKSSISTVKNSGL